MRHSVFRHKRSSIGLIGPGKVGAALLDQIAEAAPRLKREANLDLRLRAIASSKRMCARRAQCRRRLARALRRVCGPLRPRHVRDARACRAPAARGDRRLQRQRRGRRALRGLARRGIHVITPNKQAGAGPLSSAIARSAPPRRRAARASATRRPSARACRSSRPCATCSTPATNCIAVEGIFSGTLAWLFNRYDGSVAVLETRPRSARARLHRARSTRRSVRHRRRAQARDPRARGRVRDVARRRRVENLVPEALQSAGRDEFMHATRRTRRADRRAPRPGARARARAALRRASSTATARPVSGSSNCRATTRSRTCASPTTSCSSRPSATATTRSSCRALARGRGHRGWRVCRPAASCGVARCAL